MKFLLAMIILVVTASSVAAASPCINGESDSGSHYYKIIGKKKSDKPYFDVEVAIPNYDKNRTLLYPMCGYEVDGVFFRLRNPLFSVDQLKIFLHDRKSVPEIVELDLKEYYGASRLPGSTSDFFDSNLNGLMRFKRLKSPLREDDYYVGAAGTTWSDYISCSSALTRPNPGCTHMFSYRNIDVDVDYDSNRLYFWRDIKKYVVSYLDRIYVSDTAK